MTLSLSLFIFIINNFRLMDLPLRPPALPTCDHPPPPPDPHPKLEVHYQQLKSLLLSYLMFVYFNVMKSCERKIISKLSTPMTGFFDFDFFS